jgi:predicted small metal-binding protein
MRALDCVDAAHEDMHVTADTDAELVEKVREHIAQAHPDMGADQAEGIVAAGAYDEESGASPPTWATSEL